MTIPFPFQNTYSALPANFFARVAPTPVAAPRLIKLNRALAVQLGLDPDVLESPEGAEILAGKRVPEGADPIAMAYAGHQFGHFVPQLGDGRALLLGEVIGLDGVRRDIQLKGSGPTPFSRNGDGRYGFINTPEEAATEFAGQLAGALCEIGRASCRERV